LENSKSVKYTEITNIDKCYDGSTKCKLSE